MFKQFYIQVIRALLSLIHDADNERRALIKFEVELLTDISNPAVFSVIKSSRKASSSLLHCRSPDYLVCLYSARIFLEDSIDKYSQS